MNTYDSNPQAGGLSEFFAEVSSYHIISNVQRTEVATAIDTLNANVTRLDSLHTRSLNDLPDDPNAQNTHRQIDSMMADTNRLTSSIRSSIKELEGRAKAARGGDQKTMVTQTEALKKKFRDSITRFQSIEKAYRDRTRQRMERQMRIGMCTMDMTDGSETRCFATGNSSCY
jgi:syntaxin 1B/2/3